MFIPMTKTDKDTILKINTLADAVSIDDIKEVFETFLTHLIINYLDGEETYLPYIGTIHVDHLKDEIVDGMKKTNINVTIESSEFFSKLIGEVLDKSSDLVTRTFIQKTVSELEQIIER